MCSQSTGGHDTARLCLQRLTSACAHLAVVKVRQEVGGLCKQEIAHQHSCPSAEFRVHRGAPCVRNQSSINLIVIDSQYYTIKPHIMPHRKAANGSHSTTVYFLH